MVNYALDEHARLQLELWRRLIGITSDTRVNNDFAERCLQRAAIPKPDCGPLENKVREVEDWIVAGGSTESLEPLVLSLGREARWRTATLISSDSIYPGLYRIKLQETYLMLHSLCKRLRRFPWFSNCELPPAVCLWLENVETFAQISTKSLYEAFNMMRDIMLAFPAEIYSDSFFNRPNAVFSISWPSTKTVNALCNTIIRVFLQLYNEDQAYVEDQQLIRLKQCMNGIEDKAKGHYLPTYYLPVKCRDLLKDARLISRARVLSMMLSQKLPYDVTELIRLDIIEHPKLREETLASIYGQHAHLSHAQRCCPLPRAVKEMSLITVSEAKEMQMARLTCLDHSKELSWNSEKREFDHAHWHLNRRLSALISCTCKYLWKECPGHFHDNSWLLHPAGDEYWRIPGSAPNSGPQFLEGPCLFEPVTQSFVHPD